MAKQDAQDTFTKAEVEAMLARAQAETAQVVIATIQGMQKAQADATPRYDNWRDQAKSEAKIIVGCKSPDTGATFDVQVNEAGIIQSLPNYAEPDGLDKQQQDGGLVPNGLPIADPGTGRLTVAFKQWRYENYFRHDLGRYVGKKFAPYLLIDQSKAAE